MSDMKPEYKDAAGRWRTQSLFREFYQDKFDPIFTLKENDVIDGETYYPSMRRLFLSYNDPTGYQFAHEVLGSYEHWKKLIALQWFYNDHLAGWIEELEIKLKSEGLKKIKEVADADGAQAFNASKFLVSKGWSDVAAGRPKKKDIDRNKRVQAGIEAEVEDDLKRIQLVKG